MKKHHLLAPVKRHVIAAYLLMSCFLISGAESQIINCVKLPNATWSDTQSWTEGNVPSHEGENAIVNGGLSVTVDSPVAAAIDVRIGNGTTPAPDGTLLIASDFQVNNLSVGVAAQSSGRVEQSAGRVYVQELNLAGLAPAPVEATYDILGGSLTAEILTLGTMGPATLSLQGTGELVVVPSKLLAGPQSVLRFAEGNQGFPSLNAQAQVTIEPGATLILVASGSGTKAGKFTIIEASEPLAGSFRVELSGFEPGKARLLENERGVVLEVK